MVTLCVAVVRTFSVLCCTKTCKNFCLNWRGVECTKLWTSSVTPGTTFGSKISLFIKKKKKLRRRHIQLWKKGTVNRRSFATPFSFGISSSCKGEPLHHRSRKVGNQWEPLSRQLWMRSVRCLWMMIPYRNDTGSLGLMGREPARQTSKPGSNPSWDTMVHPACETFNITRVV